MRLSLWAAFAVAALTLTAPAPLYANDSAAVLEAGGLRLVRDAPVEILSERLYISPTQIEVDYRFRAAGDTSVTTLVAFPLPEYDLAWLGDSVLGSPGETVQSRSDFRIWVDSVERSPKIEIKALRNGIDVTEQLESFGISVGSLDYDGLRQQMIALSPQARARLERNDIVQWWGETEPQPLWTLKATYYWSQTFPAATPVEVRHTYTPIAGAFFISDPELRGFEPADYCMTGAEKRGVANRLEAAPHGALLARTVRYVLKTGANWQGPIGMFHLIVDKAESNALVSLCFEGFEKTGPTRFEATRKDYAPSRDLELLFVNAGVQ